MKARTGSIALYVGLTMVGVLLVLALAGPLLAPYPREYSEKIIEVPTPEGVEILYAPQPPSLRHPLGTDRWGFDILSLAFFGARYTVGAALLVAVGRLLLGGGLGLYLGSRRETGELRASSTFVAGIPAFVIVYFVMMGINFDSPLSPPALAVVQGSLMIVIGVAPIVGAVGNKARTIRRSPHVTAAIATGAGPGRVARRHVLPLLREDLLQMLAHEVVLVLTLLGQLAIFDLFFGGTERTWDPPAYWTITHEWAGMVGQSRAAIQAYQWTVLSPLLIFALAILAFQLVATGLERRTRATYAQYPHV